MPGGIEEATNAFDAAMNPGSTVDADKSGSGGVRETTGIEDLFTNLNVNEGGVAGGDDTPDEELKPKAKRKADPDEDDEEADDADAESGDDDADDEDVDADEEGDDDDADDEDDGEEAEDLLKKVTVKVDGEDVEVTLKEALEGYIRTDTFHRRLNNLREVATTVEQEAVKVAQSRDKYSELLNTLTEQLDSLVPKEPDWAKVAQEDPQNAFQRKLDWDKFKEQRALLEAEKKRVAAEKETEATENLKKFVVSERGKMLQAVPEWNDPKIRNRDQSRMSKVARKVGFSDDEISTVYDHRMMRVLLMAAKYDRLMSRKPVPSTGHSRLTKQGAGASRTAPRADVGAQKRLARTGSIDAAAEVFGGVLANEARASKRK
jgi:hypothetical protein